MKKILVAVDFSEGSIKAVHFALKLGAQFNAQLLLLHVLLTTRRKPRVFMRRKKRARRCGTIWSKPPKR